MVAMTMPSAAPTMLKKTARPATIASSSLGLDADWVRRSLLCYKAMEFTAPYNREIIEISTA
jgi:hypothetical protein